MDPRLVPVASDRELVMELRSLLAGERMSTENGDHPYKVIGDVKAELAQRWSVGLEDVVSVSRRRVSVGLPERAVVAAWGEPLRTDKADGGAVWVYPSIAGIGPRLVHFVSGSVVKVEPNEGF
jgi:hypothetical protein